jgi:predicted amidohydrolase
MKNLKLALCQMKVVDNKNQNIEKALEMISNGKNQGAEFIILPEMFNCPYENDKFIEYSETKENSPTLHSISKIAKKENVYVLAGSIPEKVIDEDEEKIYNSSFLFNRNGKIIAHYRKMHLFDIDIKDKIYFKESDVLEKGNHISVVDTEFGKIGIGICYDIRFPELSRIMALSGAKILFYPGAFNLTTGPVHWELLFKSRALDNQVFCIGVAPALNEKSTYHSYGHSLVVDPWGSTIAKCKEDEQLLIVEIDLNEVNKIREELPLLENRRTDFYGIVLKKKD